MKYGWYGSKATRREPHAPPMPRSTSTKGPAQQAEAPIAAAAPAATDAAVLHRGASGVLEAFI
jgi:hypothetical protein